VTLVEKTLEARFVKVLPKHVIGDKAYDSDALDKRLKKRRMIMIAPHKSNRRQATQDGRALRRMKRRWKIERVFSWFSNYRRLVVRYERNSSNYQGFVHLACIIILLKAFLG